MIDAFERDDIAIVREAYRQRCDLMSARTGLALRIMAIARRINGGEKVPLKAALGDEYIAATIGLRLPYEQIVKLEKQAEKNLLAAAKALPEFALIDDMRGFGALTFAAVVGECGDLRAYSTQGKLWKRMGLAIINGEAQGRRKDAKLAELHGYCPRRRAIMYNFSESAIKVGGRYAESYRARKEYEIKTQAAAGVKVIPGAEYAKRNRKGEDMTKYMPLMRVNRRAQRYIAKQALRDLWRAWRGAHAEAETVNQVVNFS